MPSATSPPGSSLRRRLLQSAAAVSLWPALARTAEPDALRLSVAAGPTLPLGRVAARWAELLREAGDGAVPVRVHPGASLAGRDAARELLALAEARADLAVGSSLQWALQVPALGVFSLPWLAPHDAELVALTQDAAVRDVLAARLANAGVVLVALAPLGYREIAAVKPIRAPEDVAGLRLRAIASPLLQDVLRALGARPQTLPFAQAQTAFAKGELDGQEGMPSSLAAARVVASGQGHVTDLGGIAEAMAFGVRAAVWNAWTPAQRERARQAAAQAIADVNALAREQAALRDLATQGASLLRLTAAGQQAFRAAASSADERWREVVGRDVVAAAERALAAVRAAAAGGNAAAPAATAAGTTAAPPGAATAPPR